MKLKIKRKTIFWISGILAFLLLINLILSIWAKNVFPEYLKEKNDSGYEIEFKNIGLSFLTGGLMLNEVTVYPKPDSVKNQTIDIKIKVKKIKISGVGFFELIKNKKLDAHKILIVQPEVYYYKSQKKEQKKSKTNFQNTIHISNFSLEEANFHIFEEDRITLISQIEKLNIEFTGVELNKKTIEKKIPFGFSTYQIGCKSFYYKINPSQEMKSNELKVNNNHVMITGFQIQTFDSMAIQNSVEKNYRLLPKISAKTFNILNMDWGFSKEDDFYFKSSKIKLDSANVVVGENPNLTKKEKNLDYLIPFFLEVGSISVKNSAIEVERNLKVKDIDLEIVKIKTDKNKILKIDSIGFNQPVISMVENKKSKKNTGELISPFRERIFVDKLSIRNASIIQLDSLVRQKAPVSEKLNLTIKDLEIGPKENYNNQVKNDNFEIKAKSIDMATDHISLIKSRKQNSEKPENKPLIPLNLELSQINFSTQTIEQKEGFLIKPVKIQINHFKNEIEGKLTMELVKINSPEITAFSKNVKKSNTDKSPVPDNIEVGKLEIDNASFNLLDAQKNDLISLKEINVSVIGLKPDNQSKFLFQDLSFSASSLSFHPKGIYDINVSSLSYQQQNLNLKNFNFKPKLTKIKFVRSLKKEKDYYSIKVPEISIQKPMLNFSGKDFFLKIPQITMTGVDAYIYRNKIPADDTSRKKMYNQLLRDIKFGLEVGQLKINNSKLVYEEETVSSSGAGKLIFANFNANISNINSGFRKKNLPDVKVLITTNFMNDSRLKVNWSFNPMDYKDRFQIKGNIYNFDAQKMTPFIKPYLHASAEGEINEVEFSFKGDNQTAKGKFGIKYNKLKATIYNPKTNQPKKFISTIGNLALKSNTKEKLNEVIIKTVTRNQEKSFFNFFWLCVQQGLKQTVLII